MSIDLNGISELLKYGFFAVSLIMIYLGYSLTKEVISHQNANVEKIKSAKFFLIMALLFMVVGGIFEVYKASNCKTVVLSIEPWHQGYEKRLGELNIRCGTHKYKFDGNYRELKIKNNASIDIEIYSLIEKADKLQTQMKNTIVQKQEIDKEIGVSDDML